jgi:hypothetical protein
MDRTGVEQLVSSISSRNMDADVNTLFHIHDTSQQFESKRNGVTIGLIAASTLLILFISYYFRGLFVGCGEKLCSEARERRK